MQRRDPSPSPVPPEVAAKMKAIADQVVQLAARGEEEHWSMGDLFNQLSDLASTAQINPATYFEQNVHAIPVSTIYRYGQVARSFSLDQARRYRMTNLQMLLKFWKRTGNTPVSGDPGDVMIPVPQQNGSMVKKRFGDCSVAELNAAITGAVTPPSPSDGSAQRLWAAIKDRLTPHTRVVVKPAARDVEGFSIENASWSEAEDIGAVLQSFVATP